VWLPTFVGDIATGGNPHMPPTPAGRSRQLTVAEFLERYFKSCVEAEGFKSAATIRGHINALSEAKGTLPASVLERPVEIARFKTRYRHGRTCSKTMRTARSRNSGEE
jgi:hypothetical protein